MTGAEVFSIIKTALSFWRHTEPPALWLDFISSGLPWHKDEIILRCDGPGRAIDIRVGDFLADDLPWHRRITVPSLGAGEHITIEAQFSHGRYEIGYLHRILRNGRQVKLPVTFCDIRGAEYIRIFVLRHEMNTSSAISVSLGKLTKRNHALETVKKWFTTSARQQPTLPRE